MMGAHCSVESTPPASTHEDRRGADCQPPGDDPHVQGAAAPTADQDQEDRSANHLAAGGATGAQVGVEHDKRQIEQEHTSQLHGTPTSTTTQCPKLDPVKPTLEHCENVEEPEILEETITMSQLRLTKPAPEWRGTAVVNGDFKEIKLSDYKGKYLVFFFYPLDFTFVCPTEIIAFSERVEEFRSIGCEVVACSTDSHFSHLAWVNTPRKQGGLGEMKIPLLADKTCEIARAYGVLKEDEGVAFRGLFIVDGKGILRQITVNDLPVGRSVDETLRLVQAFQFSDKHGEVCPAGWKPGKATMKPDPKNSKTYFQDNN